MHGYIPCSPVWVLATIICHPVYNISYEALMLLMVSSGQEGIVVLQQYICMPCTLQQSTKVVVVYDDPIGEEDDMVTLMFPGDISGSPSKRVVPERIGSRTLVFDTPGNNTVYLCPN